MFFPTVGGEHGGGTLLPASCCTWVWSAQLQKDAFSPIFLQEKDFDSQVAPALNLEYQRNTNTLRTTTFGICWLHLACLLLIHIWSPWLESGQGRQQGPECYIHFEVCSVQYQICYSLWTWHICKAEINLDSSNLGLHLRVSWFLCHDIQFFSRDSDLAQLKATRYVVEHRLFSLLTALLTAGAQYIDHQGRVIVAWEGHCGLGEQSAWVWPACFSDLCSHWRWYAPYIYTPACRSSQDLYWVAVLVLWALIDICRQPASIPRCSMDWHCFASSSLF